MNNNYKVITKYTSNNNVITQQNSNYKVYTKCKNIYKVITYYIVITFSIPAFSLTFHSELNDGKLIYGTVDQNEEIFIKSQHLNLKKDTNDLYQIQTTSDGKFVLGIPQDATELKLTIKTPTNSKEKIFSVIPRKWKEEVVNNLPPSKVIPSSENTDRINKENSLLRNARKTSKNNYFPISWKRPIQNYKRISSQFGSRRVLNGVKKQGHSGVDYAAPTGTPITSPADGKVVLTHPDMFYSGKTILIDHGYGVFSSYSHLNEINVKENQIVKQGELIGKVGTTGRSTGPHLHFTVTWYGVRINPEDLFINSQK